MVKSDDDKLPDAAAIEMRPIRADDVAALSALHADVFGPGRFARTAYRVREGTANVTRHCRAGWRDATLVGAVTMTEIAIGDAPQSHWLLGPLAVRSADANKGYGRALVQDALQSVGASNAAATVVLVGDLAYYARLGFEGVTHRRITLPGPVAPQRLLIWRGPDGERAMPEGLVRPI